jgi:hypothetical protein
VIDPLAPEEFIKAESGIFLPKEIAATPSTNEQGAPLDKPNRATRRNMEKQIRSFMKKQNRISLRKESNA